MDDLDARIIEILQKDGRASNAGIARDVGVSEGTVRRRLKRLIDDQYFSVVAMTDPVKMGYHSEGLIGIQVDPDKIDQVAAELSKLEEVNWVALSALDSPQRVLARVRYRMTVAPATVYPAEPAGTIRVVFDEPQRAITPGQSVVLYDDDLLLGGGIITATERNQPATDRPTELPATALPTLVSVT